MDSTVPLKQRRRVSPSEFAKGIFQGLGWQVGIEAYERLTQAAFQHHLAVVGIAALGRRLTGCDVRAVEYRVAQALQPGEGGFFDNGFGEGWRWHGGKLK